MRSKRDYEENMNNECSVLGGGDFSGAFTFSLRFERERGYFMVFVLDLLSSHHHY